MSKLLGKPKSGDLNCPISEVEASICIAHSDPERQVPLGDKPIKVDAKEPSIPFNLNPFKFSEIERIVQKARSGSAPGPSGLSYVVYKRCPRLIRRLWKLINIIWRTKDLPTSWMFAEGCFVPKELNSSSIDQFREISLLDVEGKIFWAAMANRMNEFLVGNNYINTSVQKGGVSGFSGCLEHTASITQSISEAKKSKLSLALAVEWLDFEKAYPSISHRLIEEALIHYNFPQEVSSLVMAYFNNLKMRFTVGNKTTKWQKLGKCIMAGCTVSVVLFITAMNVIIQAAETECRWVIWTRCVHGQDCVSNRRSLDASS